MHFNTSRSSNLFIRKVDQSSFIVILKQAAPPDSDFGLGWGT